MIQIIPADETHLADIVNTERLCFSDPWTSSSLEGLIKNPDAVFLVAMYDGEFAGYIIGQNIVGEVSLYNIAVCEKFRRRGVARKLISAFLSQSAPFDAVFLEARKSNIPARTLYESVGFIQVGERKNYYSHPAEDACLYTLFPENSDGAECE